MSSQKFSVATLVIIALVTVTTLLLGVFGCFYYAYDKNRQFSLLQNELNISADQIAAGIASPMWDYDDAQIDRIIASIFTDRNIYGVVVDADGKTRIRQRDPQWRISEADRAFPADGFLVEERNIALPGKSIGTVKVFSCPRFVKENLRKTLFTIVSIILVVDLTLILSLYLFIWNIVLKPLKIIEQYAVTFKAGGGEGAIIQGAGFHGELKSLRASIEKMVGLLDARYAALQKEAALYIESEERFRSLVEQAGDALLLIDKDGRLIDCNKRAGESLGYSRDELIGMLLPEIGSLFSQEKYDKLFSELRIDEVTTVEGREHRKDKTSFPVEVRVGRIMLRGEPHLLALIRDVTERLRAEEEREKLREKLLQAQKMEAVGRLAGGVAHDFNNMLSIIIGRAELVLMKLQPSDLIYKHICEIASVGKRSADLTRQLLGFARRQTIAPRALNLNETIESLLKMLRRLIGEDIDLLWEPAPGLWPVKMDPAQIDQLLVNLVINARDAITDVGKVTIETGNAVFDEAYCATHTGYIPGEYTLFAVSDDGCGIHRDMLPNIFEPFFTTKELGKGTGLGLATVYGIVRQNHGFISAYSELGKGSTFKIYLPRHVGHAAHATVEVPEKVVTGGFETVLVVEDEPEILEVVDTMLTELGYTVLSVGTPGEALRLSHEHTKEIHLLMTDVVMPEMNGRDLSDRLVHLHPKLKCLFMSGYTANVIAHHGVLNEGVHFIQKPFSMKDLSAKVREVLDQG